MSRLCIITARGGSKRIPRKNVRPFLGKPILQYAVEAALSSALFQTVMVSTDDPEIAETSIRLGAAVPFLRSDPSSNDYATTADVLLEVLQRYVSDGQVFDVACCCYPTAAFVTSEKLRKAYTLLMESGADTVFPVAEYSTPIFRALKMEDGKLTYFWPENATRRSQDLPKAYYDTGQFYMFRVSRFLATGTLLTENTRALEVPALEAQDIDNEEDWKLAELKYHFWLQSSLDGASTEGIYQE